VLVKSSYEGATLDAETVMVAVGESCSKPRVKEGVFLGFDFVG
jgi:hypothetical protein